MKCLRGVDLARWPKFGHSCAKQLADLFFWPPEAIRCSSFAFRGKISAEIILLVVEHDRLKWSCHVTSTI